jgi:hypothetical protein
VHRAAIDRGQEWLAKLWRHESGWHDMQSDPTHARRFPCAHRPLTFDLKALMRQAVTAQKALSVETGTSGQTRHEKLDRRRPGLVLVFAGLIHHYTMATHVNLQGIRG